MKDNKLAEEIGKMYLVHTFNVKSYEELREYIFHKSDLPKDGWSTILNNAIKFGNDVVNYVKANIEGEE